MLKRHPARLEPVISSLKGQLRLKDHLAKTLRGLIQRIAQRLLALALGIFISLLTGRPRKGARRQQRTLNPHQPS